MSDVRATIECLEQLDADERQIRRDRRELLKAAQENGLDVAALREAVRLRRIAPVKQGRNRETVSSYLAAMQ